MIKEEYALTVRHISDLFSGKFKGLKRQLAKEMKAAAKLEEYEKAQTLRRQISALEHIRDVSLIRHERVSAGGGARIEAFDVAHTAGAETVAVMTVVNNGEAYKAAYRKFKIRTATNNDVAALTEALERRLVHQEWPLPRAFVVEGRPKYVRPNACCAKPVSAFRSSASSRMNDTSLNVSSERSGSLRPMSAIFCSGTARRTVSRSGGTANVAAS
jgi:excinuclease UvrABC nuclease subunit